MREPKVCVVTPIHDGIEKTVRYLRSIEGSSYPSLEVIIVDDGSTDGSSETIARHFPDVTVLRGNGDLWWAAATNLGVQEALKRRAHFIYTVNNDVVLDPNAILAAVSCGIAEGPALVGSTVFYMDDPQRIWFAGAGFNLRTGDIDHDTRGFGGRDRVRETTMLTGMGMLIPADVFGRIGMFDAALFPHYLADCDLSLRAAKAGFRLLVSADSTIYNDVDSAWSVRNKKALKKFFLLQMLFSKRSAYWIVARVRFYRRHWGPGVLPALLRLYVTWLVSYPAPVFVRSLLRFLPGDRK